MTGGDEYAFLTRWRVEGTCGEVADILRDATSLSRWWPSVYLEVRELAPAGPGGVGGRVSLLTKGWLPYTLRWESVVTESRYPHGFTIEATGDFHGRGVWTLEQDGQFVNVAYDWRLRAGKPLIRNLSFLLRPVFEWNHRWAMRQGEESLTLELRRRRATSDVVRREIPAPPGPATLAGVGLIAAGVIAVGATAYLISRAVRKRRGSPATFRAASSSRAAPGPSRSR